MTLADVNKAVREIEEVRGDDEVAHGKEDALRYRVLEWIADNGDEASSELARAALKTEQIEFARWCA